MKQGMENTTLPNGESLAHDLIVGHALHFEGVAHGESGRRGVEGTINWSTVTPGLLGSRSVAGENQRDVIMQLVTRIGEEFDGDPDGISNSWLVAFDHDFMKRLLRRDPGAEAELLDNVAESSRDWKGAVRLEISRG